MWYNQKYWHFHFINYHIESRERAGWLVRFRDQHSWHMLLQLLKLLWKENKILKDKQLNRSLETLVDYWFVTLSIRYGIADSLQKFLGTYFDIFPRIELSNEMRHNCNFLARWIIYEISLWSIFKGYLTTANFKDISEVELFLALKHVW